MSMFEDVASFHEKFALQPTDHSIGAHKLEDDQLFFRVKFMFEELIEYCEANGINAHVVGTHVILSRRHGDFDAAKALDGLVDLTYVALGTAYLHDFTRFDEAWSRVHEANMKKVRVGCESESQRGYKGDIVKPAGWAPPVLDDLLLVSEEVMDAA